MDEMDSFLNPNYTDFSDVNYTDDYWEKIEINTDAAFAIGTNHIVALVCYSLVLLVGAPGNALVVYVTAFRMPRSVNALWFLNLALADLLCCLSLPLLMVPLSQDQHWSMGPLACKLVHGMLYLVMYCSVLLLVLISVDRWLLVSWPVWCQNWRRPRYASWVCAGVWLLALLGTAPQFAILEAKVLTKVKTQCQPVLRGLSEAWAMVIYNFLAGFLFPFLVIVASHLRVYQRAAGGGGSSRRGGRDKSARAVRVIVAVVLTFFVCWAPLHAMDIAHLAIPAPDHRFNLAHVLALCLAYVNSCLNPIIYVCMGRGFKEGLTRTLRSVLHFASEAPTQSMTVTQGSKSTSENTTERCV
ncbi:C5a anaphylatoxin chemotactic receptor 1 [Engraulis encrasicolus]|uniref:C5a anaphylatoxin chemotactic receptor 1 n=1 Tax=Engraulis encrasicolus TaxID=184585 RepID=UPI002FD6A03A